jgi:acetyl-CoA C-acetyltransferase
MRRVAIIGGGHTKFMFNSPQSGIEMLAEASMDAITKSNLKPKDVQAIYWA